MYIPISEYSNEIDALYEKGITRGVYMGFETMHEFYTIKPSATTYLFGSPFSGKTEFWLDVLVFLSEHYYWKHAIYTPESGNRAEVVAELISKYCKKQFYKQLGNHISEKEYYEARAWVSEYFYPIDPEDKEIRIDDFFNEVDRIEKTFGVHINTTCLDPFNELDHKTDGLDIDNKRQDLYIENRLGYIRRNAMKHARHNAVITHVTDQALVKGQSKDGSELWYYPPPKSRQVAGGQAWYRKAMGLIGFWRPPFNLMARDGTVYSDNECHIEILKYKPKGTGKRGTVKLFFDTTTNRYYEFWNGDKRYAGKQMLRENQERIDFVGTEDKPLF